MSNAKNLALSSKAYASESQEHLVPELAIDGNRGTRWSGIPGHNEGVWYELRWPQAITVGQVLLRQYDRYVTQLDIETWDDRTDAWVHQSHLGNPTDRLPLNVSSEFSPVKTSRIRIANICNGPSFTEVEVYENPLPNQVVLGSDLRGQFLGIVCDSTGTVPRSGVSVSLAGTAGTGTWKATAKSDEHGLFTAPMPLGLKGSVVARIDDFETEVPSGDFQYGLTPLSFRSSPMNLNGTWRFQLDPPDGFWEPSFKESGWHDILVPRSWAMEGFRSITGIAGYRKTFLSPKGQGRLKLRFDGVYSGAEVWVNGQRVAYHDGGALPFEVDITDQVKDGINLLALKVSEHTRTSDELDAISSYADIPVGGIFRKVTVFRVPNLHIGAYELSTQWDAAYRDARLVGTLSVLNESSQPLHCSEVEAILLDSNGKTVSGQHIREPFDVDGWSRNEVPLDFMTKGAKGWSAEKPYLYTLVLRLHDGDRVVQELKTRWGFRQTTIRGSELLINGQPVKMRGTCHHDADPLLGRAVTPELELLDVKLIKEANLNSLRTSHYAPLPELLEYADEYGLYVEDEGSFCWTGASDDLTLTPRIMQLNCELLARDRNHPSVYTWSVCNESTVGFGLWRSHDWIQKADPSRPLTASYQPDGSMDFAVRHNPMTITEMTELEEKLKGKTPVLWDEAWCIWQDIWGDAQEIWIDPGIRDYYIEPLPAIWKRFMSSPVVQGTKIWAWSDDIFLTPGGGLEYGRASTATYHSFEAYTMEGRGMAGDTQWGVVDNWRRKKPEFYHTKKLHSPVKVSEEPLPLDRKQQIKVRNEYDFLNLSELNIAWSMGSSKGLAKVDVKPHSEGTIEVQLPVKPVLGDVLGLAIVDSKGAVVDSYRLTFGKKLVSAVPHRASPKPFKLASQAGLNGQTRFLLNGDFELGFNTYNGWLRRGFGFGQALLRSMPLLHMLPTGDPDHPVPDLRKWKQTGFEMVLEGEDVRVEIRGEYPLMIGTYTYLIHPDGTIDAKASFDYSGDEVKVREVGMSFSVPREADLLAWDRNGEYSVYPEDHIGRSRGQARAFSTHKPGLPPKWSWSEDNTPLGSNDFRSTKRHLNWGWIGYPDGPGVVVESDGSQALRACVMGDRIDVFVNDFYGGIASSWEWVANYGTGRVVKKGEKIEVAVKIRLAPSR